MQSMGGPGLFIRSKCGSGPFMEPYYYPGHFISTVSRVFKRLQQCLRLGLCEFIMTCSL